MEILKRIENTTPSYQRITRAYFSLLLFCVAVVLSMYLLQGCKRVPVQPTEVPKITLSVEQVSCSEAIILVKTENSKNLINSYFELDDLASLPLTLPERDTMLRITNLGINTKHTFKITGNYTNELEKTVRLKTEITFQTMDSSSHNFSWEVFNLGEIGISVLHDVAVISKSDIWAVGMIHMKDSLGQIDNDYYNAAHWNGQKWELHRIKYAGGNDEIRTIIAFGPKDIWFSVFIHYDGTRFKEIPLTDVLRKSTITRLWGRSSSDLYGAGEGGTVIHYNGSNWSEVNCGLTRSVEDIWGINLPGQSFPYILCTHADIYRQVGSQIVNIKTNGYSDTIRDDLSLNSVSVWFKEKKSIYTVGNGMYRRDASGLWREIVGKTSIKPMLTCIRGLEENDIFAVGHYGVVIHYNGVGIKRFSSFEGDMIYNSLDMNSDIVAIVGEQIFSMIYSNARIILLKRN